MNTTKAVAHRARQARGLALRAQLAWMLAQLLLWVLLIGAVVGAAVWAWHRFKSGPDSGTASAPASPTPAQTVTSDTSAAGLSG
ncbi:hypothetical protein A5634_24295 [Mycobacterium asiaticum]|uniref:Uncharacterized protein n=1 Tax=Mycobacterium asiaticum TaxID=1790 RepID=A0A1A3P2W7_MYCAS|nr:hypothetical protein [Mycobacterium asiaticum]OBK26927.1 hypothetical protein A5634_24295 [Mycobacterium asiaticum]